MIPKNGEDEEAADMMCYWEKVKRICEQKLNLEKNKRKSCERQEKGRKKEIIIEEKKERKKEEAE